MNGRPRHESDSLGEVEVPANALYGAQTERARRNFAISDLRPQPAFLTALANIKWACARANARLGVLDAELADAIAGAAREIADGRHREQFVVDVFQTGSGTSTNMNANEIIARLASRTSGRDVHPNDHVNRGQSSNDVIPTAMRISAVEQTRQDLEPALARAVAALEARAADHRDLVKTGRTHLMDATPIRAADEIGAWASQLAAAQARVRDAASSLAALPLGGTAVGNGLNAHPQAAALAIADLEDHYGCGLRPAENRFAAQGSLDDALALSGALRGLATAILKLVNDIRWMNSGPVAGLAEIRLPALQPGSSIMPGKVNPVIPEAVAMVAAHVIGNDASVAVAAESSNFQLNVMQPLVAFKLLESIGVSARALEHLERSCLRSLAYDTARLEAIVSRNAMLVTALAPRIGYDIAADIAEEAAMGDEAVIDIARRLTDLSRGELEELLDPARLADGGIVE